MVNLAGARRAVNRVLADSCAITHNAKGNRDDVLDAETGALSVFNDGSRPTGLTWVYSGPCLLSPETRKSTDEAGQPVEVKGYKALLPADADVPVDGDIFTVTAIGPYSDPTLAGRSFTVIGFDRASLLAGRVLHLQGIEAAERHL